MDSGDDGCVSLIKTEPECMKEGSRLWSESVRLLTGTGTDRKAWKALFTYYNRTHGRGRQGYRQGELIAVKINLNNTFSPQDRDNDIDQSAEGVVALLRQLTGNAGGREDCAFGRGRCVWDADQRGRPATGTRPLETPLRRRLEFLPADVARPRCHRVGLSRHALCRVW